MISLLPAKLGRRLPSLLVLAAIAACSAAEADNMPAPPQLFITASAPGVSWLKTPEGFDVYDNYPREAVRQSADGLVAVNCVIASSGELTRCKVACENSPALKFGDAALHMTAAGMFRLRITDPSVIGTRMNILVRFFTLKRPVPQPNEECFAAAAPEKR